jgi:Tfp pilus assembly protein PilN
MNALNFARTPFVNERLPRALFAAAVVVVAGLTVFHGFLLQRYLSREQEALDIKVADLQQGIARTNAAITEAQNAIARNRIALASEQASFLTTLYRRKSFSWTGLFNELEEIAPPAVRITSIAPAEEEGEIEVTMNVVGRTLQDILEMVKALEASSFFATVFPLDETNLEAEERGETGIAATLRLDYVEDVRKPSEPEPAPREDTETQQDTEPEEVVEEIVP